MARSPVEFDPALEPVPGVCDDRWRHVRAAIDLLGAHPGVEAYKQHMQAALAV